MANASKRTPWVVEMLTPALPKWFAMSAHRDADEAKANAALYFLRMSGMDVKIRVRNAYTDEVA